MTRADDIRAVLFDKDGTLFDFEGTWNAFAVNLLKDLCGDDGLMLERAAWQIRFDLVTERYLPDSPAITCTNRELAHLLAEVLPQSIDVLEEQIVRQAALAPLVEAAPLKPLLEKLRARGLVLGVMTNDHAEVARAHLGTAGVLEQFDFVAGADSGFGAKPAPGPLLAFAHAKGLPPQQVVMVGDSQHDLAAARAAGMRGVGVLTGMAGRDELGALADVVMPDIGHLIEWIDRQTAGVL
ncbi:HAD family hydrolase [Sagittula sp. SSi028]|uniref:HAD family hydrolase n=1 Tax=Sagittula sp. SSi028 TaxID=3400636 RepID=UPI003AF68CCE